MTPLPPESTRRVSSAPRSRRERPAKAALRYDGIVATAVRLMQAEGLGRVTMRRLAKELDTGPATLYVYVRNTAELHAAVLDTLLGEVGPPPADGDWRDRIAAVLGSYTQVLFAHPSLAQAALVARPYGAHYLALVETLLRLLHEGGVPDEQAAWGVDILLQVATATAAEHAGRRGGRGAAAEEAAAAEAVRDADAERYPRLAAMTGELLAGTPEQRLGWIFRSVVNGVASTPRDLD